MGLTGNWDTRISRRTLLATGRRRAAAGIVLLGALARSAKAAPPFAGYPFTLGVASGDPTPTAIVLWTRLAPGAARRAAGCRPRSSACASRSPRDEQFRRIVRRGAIEAIAGGGAHRARRDRRPPARARSTGTASSGARPRARSAGPAPRRRRLHARADAVRVRVVPELRERLLHRLRRHGAAGPRPRRAPRRLHLRGPGTGRRRASATTRRRPSCSRSTTTARGTRSTRPTRTCRRRTRRSRG